jgi:hypothetical protein
LGHLLHATFLVPSLSHVACLSDEIGCLLHAAARWTCRRLGEDLLLVRRRRDTGLTGSAGAGCAPVALLIAREHLLLMLCCGKSSLDATRSSFRLGDRRFETLDFLTAVGKSRSGDQRITALVVRKRMDMCLSSCRRLSAGPVASGLILSWSGNGSSSPLFPGCRSRRWNLSRTAALCAA